jgi:4-hydroxy-3-polyprenylbenzoate decarboxylase
VSASPRRIVVGISGASGAAFGLRVLQICRQIDDIETHVVVSRGSRSTIHSELGMTVRQVTDVADVVHQDGNLGATISSGSFRTAGMIVAPCSMKALSGIANSFDESLLVRAADVTLKERRPLVLMVRETPLHLGHLRLMTLAAESGAIIYPPVPAMYTMPASVDDLINHACQRALEQLGVFTDETKRWNGIGAE